MHSDIAKGRFAAKVKIGLSTGCIEWIGAISRDGYGVFHPDGKLTRSAHRVAFEMYKGEIPPGAFVLHRCDNPVCVNPSHLFLGTHAQNMRDRNLKGRQSGPKGERNWTSKLTSRDVLAIRAASAPASELAAQYGVRVAHIGKIRRGEIWKHLLEEQQ